MIPKFRVWDKNTHDIVGIKTIDLEKDGSIGCIVDFSGINLDISECVIMQSTGLKDKNGVEIFEGDIIKNLKGVVGYIAFLQQEAGFVVVLSKSDYRLGHRNTGESYDVASGHEVLGNIYENTELLEGAWNEII